MNHDRARFGRMFKLSAGLAVLGLTSTAASADARPRSAAPAYRVVASGFDNPRGLDVGPEGGLIVSSTGRGGTGDCVDATDPETGEPITQCLGRTGAVDLLISGHKIRLATLPSIAVPEGSDSGGPSNTAVGPDGSLDIVMTGNDTPGFRGDTSSFGKVLNQSVSGLTRRADLAGYEATHNPDGAQVDSNPYGIAWNGRYSAVADAGANDLLEVGRNGRVSTLAVFPSQLVPWPAGLPFGPPPGTPTPAESVPTSVTVGPDGAFYVGELTGFPFAPGAARVWRVVPGHAPTVYAHGFTNIIDLQFDNHGRLYVLELAKHGLLSGDPTGALIRVGHNGKKTVVASAGLTLPGGLAIAGSRIYVTNNSTSRGAGQVLRIR